MCTLAESEVFGWEKPVDGIDFEEMNVVAGCMQVRQDYLTVASTHAEQMPGRIHLKVE